MVKILILVHPDCAVEAYGPGQTFRNAEAVGDYWQQVADSVEQYEKVYTLWLFSEEAHEHLPTVFEQSGWGLTRGYLHWRRYMNANTRGVQRSEVGMDSRFFKNILANDVLDLLTKGGQKQVQVCFGGGKKDICLKIVRENYEDFRRGLEDMLSEASEQPRLTYGNPRARKVSKKNPRYTLAVDARTTAGWNIVPVSSVYPWRVTCSEDRYRQYFDLKIGDIDWILNVHTFSDNNVVVVTTFFTTSKMSSGRDREIVAYNTSRVAFGGTENLAENMQEMISWADRHVAGSDIEYILQAAQNPAKKIPSKKKLLAGSPIEYLTKAIENPKRTTQTYRGDTTESHATRIDGQRVVISFVHNRNEDAPNCWRVELIVGATRQQKKNMRSGRVFSLPAKTSGTSGLTALRWAVEQMDLFQRDHPEAALIVSGEDHRREKAYRWLTRKGFIFGQYEYFAPQGVYYRLALRDRTR